MTSPYTHFEHAIELSRAVAGTTAPNPAVGCVITSADYRRVLGEGATQPAGGNHAEIEALLGAGDRARGGCAFVTLEPCAHTGRTGPCTQALIEAGIAEVHLIHRDPNPLARGGVDTLRAAGVRVVEHPELSSTPLHPWLVAQHLGRACITWKTAHTLDGFTAAIDGSSQWITGEPARARVHYDRSQRDAIIVGTGTALADNPRLTARKPDGTLYDHQPEPIVVGTRPIPSGSHLARTGAKQCATIAELLDYLRQRGHVDVLVEGGAHLARSLLQEGLVDTIDSYTAPSLFGAGKGLVDGVLADSVDTQLRFELAEVERLGNDVLLRSLSPRAAAALNLKPQG